MMANSRQALLALLLGATVLASGLPLVGGSNALPAEPVTKAIVFQSPTGTRVIEYLPALDTAYTLTLETTSSMVSPDLFRTYDRYGSHFSLATYDDAGDVAGRALLFLPADTQVVEVVVPRAEARLEPPPQEAAIGPANHGGRCHSLGFCSDLDTQFVLSNHRMWHGLQINDYAPSSTSPSTTYYQMPCNSHVGGCISTSWAKVWHTSGSTYGELRCWKHIRSSNNWMVVSSLAAMGSNTITSSNTHSTSTDTASC